MYRISTVLATVAALAASTAVCAAQTKLAYIPCGQINDHSWSQSGYEGVVKAKEELAAKGTAITIDYTESLQPAQVEAAARDYASRGYNPIVIHCGTFADAAYNAAKAFPNTTFLTSNPPEAKDVPKNFWVYDALQQEGAFVGGYLAGLVTKSNRVGVVGGFDFPALTRQVEGFRLGARYANPQVKSLAVYINSWEDAGKAKQAAQAQLDSGADIVFAATDQAARGVFAAAENANAYAIAAYADLASLAPKTILASVLFDYPRLVAFVTVSAIEHTLVPGKLYLVGMAGGVGEVVPNPALYDTLPADVRNKVTALTQAVKSGAIQIPMMIKPNESEGFDIAKLTAK